MGETEITFWDGYAYPRMKSRGQAALKDARLYLQHMLARYSRITHFIQPGKQAFVASEEMQDAVIRNSEVMGEAAKRISAESRARLSSLDWKAICGMRDVLTDH